MRRLLKGLLISQLHDLCDEVMCYEDNEFLKFGGYSAPISLWQKLIAEEYERRSNYKY